jgi:hypothetical protein
MTEMHRSITQAMVAGTLNQRANDSAFILPGFFGGFVIFSAHGTVCFGTAFGASSRIQRHGDRPNPECQHQAEICFESEVPFKGRFLATVLAVSGFHGNPPCIR